jgi:hypothetical protein
VGLLETITTILIWSAAIFLWTRAFDAVFPEPPNWWEKKIAAKECKNRRPFLK